MCLIYLAPIIIIFTRMQCESHVFNFLRFPVKHLHLYIILVLYNVYTVMPVMIGDSSVNRWYCVGNGYGFFNPIRDTTPASMKMVVFCS